MTPAEIDLARRIIACGLPVPQPRHRSFFDTDAIVVKLGNEVVATCHNPGSTDYDPATRILWQVVTTDTGPELLPVLDDYALLGWLTHRFRAVYGSLASTTPNPYVPDAQLWSTYAANGDEITSGPTEIEALVAALEAAKAAK